MCDKPAGQHEDIGIVVLAAEAGDPCIPTKGGTNCAMLVQSH